jgi:hypothetical protein
VTQPDDLRIDPMVEYLARYPGASAASGRPLSEIRTVTVETGADTIGVASGWPDQTVHTVTVEATGGGPSSVASGRLPDPIHTFTVGSATEPVTVRLDDPPADRTIRMGHGLVYVHRDGQGYTILDRGQYRQTAYPRMPLPERDVARALLVHALGELDAMDEADGRKGTVRG